ncbi:hypothetical protein AK88_01382 [Plasmodium fragile]|uniref:Uncharacterized protein n=1 Tax=Plasmodium fragile TaxID=5857 RepID=A0A0D9QPN0_PLAFR|nr:uncharacterized protein AK88_01382 [Plasmodium fragile]KJP88888.1 hypothetical protein AK88_01382 [Plasmodium fragile]
MADDILQCVHQQFKYVLISSDINDQIKELTFSGTERKFQGVLASHFRRIIFDEKGKNELKESIKEKLKVGKENEDGKNGTEQNEGQLNTSAITPDLINNAVESSQTYQIIPLTIPNEKTNFFAVNCYIDDIGRIKKLPYNSRASRICSTEIFGDAFLSKTYDNEDFRRCDFTISEYEQFLQNPPKAENRWDQAQAMQDLLKQMQNQKEESTAIRPPTQRPNVCEHCYTKMLFVDLLNGVNINYKRRVPICKRPTKNAEYFSNQPLHANRNAQQISSKGDEVPITTHNDERDEHILQQYIYTLSHLTIFDVDRDKSTPLNIALLLKACLASHNYIKNVEIFTSDVKNKEICSFIYESRNDFHTFFKMHVMKYIDFFENPQMMETLKSYNDNEQVYQRELEIFNQIDKDTKVRKDILEDILFECTRLNKIIQYSLAINNFNLFSPIVMLKLFTYFKNYGIYYHIFVNNIKRIKYYYETKELRSEDKRKIEKIVDHYLLTLDRFNDMYEAGHAMS